MQNNAEDCSTRGSFRQSSAGAPGHPITHVKRIGQPPFALPEMSITIFDLPSGHQATLRRLTKVTEFMPILIYHQCGCSCSWAARRLQHHRDC